MLKLMKVEDDKPVRTCQYCRRWPAHKLIKVANGRRWKCEHCISKANKPGVF